MGRLSEYFDDIPYEDWRDVYKRQIYNSNKYKDSKTNQYKSEYIRTFCYKGERWSKTENR